MVERIFYEDRPQDEATVINPDGGNGTAPIEEQHISKDCEDAPHDENEKSIGQLIHEGIWEQIDSKHFPDVPEDKLFLHRLAAMRRYQGFLQDEREAAKPSPSLTTPQNEEWAAARKGLEDMIEEAEAMRLDELNSFISKYGKKSR